MFCSLCLRTRYDAVQNRHATKFIAELFPDLTIDTHPILCQDCSSMLDQYSNVKTILEINKMTLKGKELNEQNFANLSKPNCLLCSEPINREVCKLETDYLSPPLDSDLDFEHKSTTLCTNCELIVRNLKSFKIRCYKILSQMQSFKNPPSLQKVENKDNIVSPFDGCKVTKDVLTKNEGNYSIYPETSYQNFSLNFKIYIVQRDKRELKPIKRSGVYLYTCPICQNMITDIHKHFKLHNGMNAHILYECVSCNFEGKTLIEMKLHICESNSLNEDNENIYCCKICPFKGKQKGNLKTHMMIHKSIKEIPMYKCKQCKFRSRQKGNLQTHLLVHKPREEIKMYKCLHCIFQARQKGNLFTHILKKHKNE